MIVRAGPARWAVLAAFAAIYFVWGSSFLALRYAVAEVPPFALVAARSVTAGVLLLGGARLLDRRANGGPFAWPTRREWGHATVAGLFLFGGGHGLLALAEHAGVPSGVAALALTAIPICLVLLDAVRPGGARPSARVVLGMVTGIAGIALLAEPGAASAGGVALLLASALSWAAGSLYARHAPRPASAVVHTGAQVLTAGAVLFVGSALAGERPLASLAGASPRALVSLAYLVLFGSIVCLTAYTWLLRVSTPARVGTYAFVNPIVAVLLGWAVGGEALTPRLAVALVVVLAGVGLVVTAPRRADREGAGGFTTPSTRLPSGSRTMAS